MAFVVITASSIPTQTEAMSADETMGVMMMDDCAECDDCDDTSGTPSCGKLCQLPCASNGSLAVSVQRDSTDLHIPALAYAIHPQNRVEDVLVAKDVPPPRS